MTILHIFTEEPSIKNIFDVILPKILPDDISFRIYPHQGKKDLEKALKTTVPSISKIPGSKIIITCDQDKNDCKVVKLRLLDLLGNQCQCDFFVRIICTELESWFLGDLQAIEKAFPRFKRHQYAGRIDFRDVDRIDKPSDYLLRIVPEYLKRESLPKLEFSQKIAPYLDIENNLSTSFNQTIQAIRKIINKWD
ncbi:MAG: DUF4276 family protein [Candidatus Symbiothrix sp.]|jgi:hypothetical protein|nr:DUF4276 family protein [Candidatus Symbiothrix sp.]